MPLCTMSPLKGTLAASRFCPVWVCEVCVWSVKWLCSCKYSAHFVSNRGAADPVVWDTVMLSSRQLPSSVSSSKQRCPVLACCHYFGIWPFWYVKSFSLTYSGNRIEPMTLHFGFQFNLWSQMAYDAKFLFVCLFSICIPSLMRCPDLGPFSN